MVLHRAFLWRNFNFSSSHRAGWLRPPDARNRAGTRGWGWWRISHKELRPRSAEGGIWLRAGSQGWHTRYTRGWESNYLNIRRRRRALRAGIFHGSAPYYASNLRPAVRARCFSGSRSGMANERVRAVPSDAELLRPRAAFDAIPSHGGCRRREKWEGWIVCTRRDETDSSARDGAVGGAPGVACCARYWCQGPSSRSYSSPPTWEPPRARNR